MDGSALAQRPMAMSRQRMRALEESLERVELPEIGRKEDPYPA
jgi:RecB family exonuclease